MKLTVALRNSFRTRLKINIAKFHFKDIEVPAYVCKAWSYNTVSFVPNTTRTLDNVQHNVDTLNDSTTLSKVSHLKNYLKTKSSSKRTEKSGPNQFQYFGSLCMASLQ
jgi:hypothetical protein